MEDIFTPTGVNNQVARINKLTAESKPLWGRMTVAQMLAHCCVSYEMVYEDKHPRPNGFMKFILKLLVKKAVVGDAPYKHNGQTAPAFIITGDRDFDTEKARLIGYVKKTQELGEAYFTGRESHSFGVLTIAEWNTMFAKHLDHHLQQFGV